MTTYDSLAHRVWAAIRVGERQTGMECHHKNMAYFLLKSINLSLSLSLSLSLPIFVYIYIFFTFLHFLTSVPAQAVQLRVLQLI